MSAAALPPVGTRWGDLTPEQREALPIGTEMTYAQGLRIVKVRKGQWKRKLVIRGVIWVEAEFSENRVIARYPDAP